MTLKIKQGDAIEIPVEITLNSAPLDISMVSKVEFQLGKRIRKVYPGEVSYDEESKKFYMPVEQQETLMLRPDSIVPLDVRVKFTDNDVIGARRMEYIEVTDAVSREVI